MDKNSENILPIIDNLKHIVSPFANQYFVGHRSQRNFLTKMVTNNNLHHALLFTGKKGIGKFTLAFRFAYNLINNGDDLFKNPVLSSSLWRQMVQNVSANFLYIRKAYDETTKKFKQYITVDDVSTIKKFLNYNNDSYNIIIIDAIDDLNINSSNAILKILEEPPKNTIFILISHKDKPILPTIKSRCMRLNFLPLSDEEVLNSLEHCLEVDSFSKAKAEDIVKKAYGSVGKASELYLTDAFKIEESLISFLNIKKLNIASLQSLLDNAEHEQIKEATLNYVSDLAKELSNNASIFQANKLCLLWKDIQHRLNMIENYNLDKNQELFNIIVELYNIKKEHEKI